MNNKMKIEFLSKSINESFARATVAAFVSQLDPTIDEIADIKTAVSEGVTNAIIHGYGHENGIVKIECMLSENSIIVEIEDYGKGIADTSVARKPFYTESNVGERSGMGFTVMEMFMDTLDIISATGKGTKLIMTKSLYPAKKS